ncbi:helix-turn-helix protein [Breznakibacter xylanolyticus]|uniref:Helix-turn-helix protein n=1 Tax=Breznakibacter xylanolyticus TaxID=990 RepID=A0A2W7NDV9_9BACT|nr:helix-turn-helix transcriptional regulator [Breznakibacter xylanolyticus]PZX11276.1 helix-turn-helix protein [Breznakibacter xylanolyticus]
MKEIHNIKEIACIERLENEYDLQKASLLERKLRLMSDENPHLKPLRNKLRDLIKDYEDRHWSDLDNISDSQIKESDTANVLIENETVFIQKRKETIRTKLKAHNMTQQDLGTILGHPKSYMSELMNGVSQFSLKDLVIIHRILGIHLNHLIPTFLQPETREKVNSSINKLNNPKIKLKNTETV